LRALRRGGCFEVPSNAIEEDAMAYLEHLEQLRTTKRRRLQILEEQQARSGYSTEPAILLEIEEIYKELATLQRKITQEWLNLFQRYEARFDRFLSSLAQRDPYRREALNYQHRLRDLIHAVREHGDSDARTTECEQLVQQINDLAIATTGNSLKNLVESFAHSNSSGSSEAKTGIGRDQPQGATTTNIYGSVGAMHSGSGDIYVTNASEPAANPLHMPFALLRRAVSRQVTSPDLLAKALRKLDDLLDAIRQADIDELQVTVAWLQKHLSLGFVLNEFLSNPAVYTTIRSTSSSAAEEFMRRVGSSER
jgi:hypothetical protein